MKRAWPIVAVIAVLVAVGLAAAPSSASSANVPAPARHVVVVLAPYLTWSDMTATATPTLWRLAEQGAIGGANVRSRTREMNEPPTPTEGALSLSAGGWASPEFLAPAAYNATETYDTSTAASAYRRIIGSPMGDARIGFLGLPMTQRTNAVRRLDVTIGTLGQAIRDAGGTTAAIGNSDAGYVSDPSSMRWTRPAALVAMDTHGRVRFGDVSPDLLRDAPRAPYGRETDLRRFEAAYDEADRLTAAHAGPSLIVLDPGDGYRARRFAPQASDVTVAAQHAAALRTLDAVVAMADARRSPDSVLIVVSQVLHSEPDGALDGFGPVVVAGTGWSGYLTSPSTHRVGLVTNLDVTAGVLGVLGITRPVQVLGNDLQTVSGPSGIGERVETLNRASLTAVAIDGPKPIILSLYIGLVVIVMACSAIVVARAHRWSYRAVGAWVGGLKAAGLFLLALPLGSWLMFLITPSLPSAGAAIVSLLGTSLFVWALCLVAWRRLPSRVTIAVLPIATVLVMLLDQLFGAPLSFASFFGYSPLLAARFYGMGNEAAALLFGAAIVAVALLLDQWPTARWSVMGRRYGLAVLGVLVVGVAAAPGLGANVGVAVWGLVGFSLALVLMNGKRPSWKLALVTAAAMVLVIGAFAAVDLFGGGEQTHLGRALASAQQDGLGQLWTIVIRKAETNARVFTNTNWSWILIAVLAFLASMRFSPKGDFADTLNENPYFSQAVTITLVAGVVAFFSEDSGIVIPALIMLYVGVALAWLMLSRLLVSAEARA